MDYIIKCCSIYFIIFNILSYGQGRNLIDDEQFINDPIKGVLFDETNPANWFSNSRWELERKLQLKPNTNIAKNVIIVIGDGMSIPTLAATRVYLGNKYGLSGEEQYLSFEKFPHTGIIKTYCVDSQVPDSACTATAYLTGVKTNKGTIGVTAAVNLTDCDAQNVKENRVRSIAGWAQDRGKKTGFATTTRVTHASPAGVFGNTADRDWEADSDVVASGKDPVKCPDLAKQLVEGDIGRKLDVVLGGGRKNFLPNTTQDPEAARLDGRDLINEWLENKRAANKAPVFVKTLKELQEFNLDKADSLLGLFEYDHMKYHLESTPEDPTLADLATTAVKVLQHNNDQGFFLFLEGGRIDHAHHSTYARNALEETVEMSKAIEEVLKLVDLDETLVIVTSDHSHTLSFSGYNTRGSDVLGISEDNADDGQPYMILGYANGENNDRFSFLTEDIKSVNFSFPSLVPLSSETHGGDDVAIFAVGPWAHLFTGVNEQSFIPFAAAFASCLGSDITACDRAASRP